ELREDSVGRMPLSELLDKRAESFPGLLRVELVELRDDLADLMEQLGVVEIRQVLLAQLVHDGGRVSMFQWCLPPHLDALLTSRLHQERTVYGLPVFPRSQRILLGSAGRKPKPIRSTCKLPVLRRRDGLPRPRGQVRFAGALRRQPAGDQLGWLGGNPI